MKLFRLSLATILSLQFVWQSSFAKLGSIETSPLSVDEKALLAKYQKSFGSAGFDVKVDHQTRTAFLVAKQTQAKVLEIPLAEPAELNKWSPRSLNSTLIQMAKKAGSVSQSALDEAAAMKTMAKKAATHSLRNLPYEALVFFSAMGAVTFMQLQMDVAQNPLAFEQFLEHQTSPIGLLGFYIFMSGQGITTNILSMYNTNPWVARFALPYVGMAVGGFMQQYISGFAMDPNVQLCAKNLARPLSQIGKNEEKAADEELNPCEKAYQSWVSTKKLIEMAPTLVSMVLSGAIAAAVQGTLSMGARLAGYAELAFYLSGPGMMTLKGAKLFLAKGLQIGAFVGFDIWLHYHVTTVWQNIFDSKNAEVKLVNSIGREEFKSELNNFGEAMAKWRMNLLTKTFEAHHNWSTYLTQLTGLYNGTYATYGLFIDQIVEGTMIKSSSPLNGVTPMGLLNDDLYMQHPKHILAWQMDTLIEVVNKTKERLSSSHYTQAGLKSNEIKFIADFVQQIEGQSDLNKVGLALGNLNGQMNRVRDNLVAYSPNFYRALHEIRVSLGEPDPIFDIGRGYVESVKRSSSFNKMFDGVKHPAQTGNFETPHILDHLVVSAVCGVDPDKGDRVLTDTMGFAADFHPPALVTDNTEAYTICQRGGKLQTPMIYRASFEENGEKYRGAMDYLMRNIKPQVLTSNQNTLKDWWIAKTDTQMREAFARFQAEYKKIIGRLLGDLFRADQKSPEDLTNRGDLSNVAALALLQELRIYLLILDGQGSSATLLKARQTVALQNPELASLQSQFETALKEIAKLKATTITTTNPIESQAAQRLVQRGLLMQLPTQKSERVEITGNMDKSVLDGLMAKTQELLSEENSMSPEEKEVLNKVASLAMEVVTFGSMINAVNWDALKGDLEAGKTPDKTQRRTGPGLTGAGR